MSKRSRRVKSRSGSGGGVSVERFVMRMRLKKRMGWVGVLVVLAVLVALDRAGWLEVAGPGEQRRGKSADIERYDGKRFMVVKVVDGDTIDVDLADGKYQTTRIRFWGIDTPEVAKDKEGKTGEPFAEEAKEYTLAACMGKRVVLRLEDHSTRGKFGRLLAYVVLEDGRVLNEELLREGLARYEGRFSHGQLERYRELERDAKERGVGMWER